MVENCSLNNIWKTQLKYNEIKKCVHKCFHQQNLKHKKWLKKSPSLGTHAIKLTNTFSFGTLATNIINKRHQHIWNKICG